MSGRASSVHGVKSSDSVIILVVVSYRKSRTFSVNIYYYSAQSIYGSTITLLSLTSTIGTVIDLIVMSTKCSSKYKVAKIYTLKI